MLHHPAWTIMIRPAAETTLLEKIGNHIMTGVYLDLTRYVVAAGLLTILLFVFRRWANDRRIQARTAKRGDYTREVLSSLRTVVVFAVTTITTLVLREYGIIQLKLDGPSLGLIGVQFAIIVVVHDAYFYWMHRGLHHKRLFRATHQQQHLSRTPTP